MNEDIIAIEKSTKKEQIYKFYKKNKNRIFLSILVVIIFSFSILFYIDFKKKIKLKLSDQYVKASILLNYGNRQEATNNLKEIVLSDDGTYSTLALFLMINQNLIEDKREIENLFNHVINNNKFDEEIKNLLIFKKALSILEFEEENKILQTLNPLIKSNSVWKPHALILLGDYFFYKKNFIKAREFYSQVLLTKNANEDLYQQAILQIGIMSSD